MDSQPSIPVFAPPVPAEFSISTVLDLAHLSCADLGVCLAALIREAIAHRCPSATEAIKLTTLLTASMAADLRCRIDADRAVALAAAEPGSPTPN